MLIDSSALKDAISKSKKMRVAADDNGNSSPVNNNIKPDKENTYTPLNESSSRRRETRSINSSSSKDSLNGKSRFSDNKVIRASAKSAGLLLSPPKFSKIAEELHLFDHKSQSEWSQKMRKNFALIYSAVHSFIFPDIPEAFPLRKKILMAKNTTTTGNLWDVFQVVLSVLACAFYVYETYVGSDVWSSEQNEFEAKRTLNLLEIYITIFFAIDFFLNWYISASRLAYLGTAMAIIDMLTIIPLLVTLSFKSQNGSYNLNNFAIFRFVRILRLVRILRTFRLLGGLSGVKRQVITLCLTLASLIFLAAGIIHVMENDLAQDIYIDCKYNIFVEGLGDDITISDGHGGTRVGTYKTSCTLEENDYRTYTYDDDELATCDCKTGHCVGDYSLWQTLEGTKYDLPENVKCHLLSFFHCFYFIVVTISTVGYGDINPTHDYSRSVTILFILISVVIIPIQANKLVALLSMGSVFRNPYNPAAEESHIIVCGFVNDKNKLERFFKEFFHPDRSLDADFRAIVLCPHEPIEDVRALLVSPVFDSRVVYMVGSALNADDLQNARADIATAMFFLANVEVCGQTADMEDAATVLKTLSVSNFNPDLEVFVQVIKEENRDILKDSDVDVVICLDEFKTILQARNAICPGFSTLIELLFMSFGDVESKELPWFEEYLHGAGMEIYYVPLHKTLLEAFNCEWTLMVEALYLVFGVTMIGVCNTQEQKLCINPTDSEMNKFHSIKDFFKQYNVGIVVTGDQSNANNVAFVTADYVGLENLVDKVTDAESHFQVRSLPKKESRFPQSKGGGAGGGATGGATGNGRRLSASSSLAEFAQMNQDSGVMKAVTMETLSEGARFFRELKVPENSSKATKLNPFEPRYGHDDEIIHDKKNNIRARLSRSRTATIDFSTLESPSCDDADYDSVEGDIEEGGGGHEDARTSTKSSSDISGSRKRTNSKDKTTPGGSSSKNSSPRKMVRQLTAFNSPLEPSGLEAGEILDADALSRHVIIAGSMGDLPRFISEMRRSLINTSDSYHPILVVAEETPENWLELLSWFDDIYFFRGKITNTVDFEHVNVEQAFAVILLALRSGLPLNEDDNLDSDILFAYLKLETYIPKEVFFTVELTIPSNMAVLNSTIMRRVRRQEAKERLELTLAENVGGHFSKEASYNGSFSTKRTRGNQEIDEPASWAGEEEDGLTAEEVMRNMMKSVGRDMTGKKVEENVKDEKSFFEFTSAEASFWDATNTHHTLPVFSAGRAFVPSTYDSLLCQSFFGSLTPILCEKLITGQRHQTVYQILVPSIFIGRKYQDLFRAFVSRHLMPIGLYRATDHEAKSSLPFVYICPPFDAKLRSGDRMYVFGSPHRLTHALKTSLSFPLMKGKYDNSMSLHDTNIS